MKLTEQTSYALRVFAACAEVYPNITKVAEIAAATGITEFNIFKLLKVATKHDLIISIRGPAGGIKLSRAPDQMFVGQVIRVFEPRFQDCGPAGLLTVGTDPDAFTEQVNQILGRGYRSFLRELDRVSLMDLLSNPPPSISEGGRSQ